MYYGLGDGLSEFGTDRLTVQQCNLPYCRESYAGPNVKAYFLSHAHAGRAPTQVIRWFLCRAVCDVCQSRTDWL